MPSSLVAVVPEEAPQFTEEHLGDSSVPGPLSHTALLQLCSELDLHVNPALHLHICGWALVCLGWLTMTQSGFRFELTCSAVYSPSSSDRTPRSGCTPCHSGLTIFHYTDTWLGHPF